MNFHWILLSAALLLVAAFASAGDIQRDPPPQETLQFVLDRIHTHAGGTSWKEAGWTDAAIEGWLEKVLKQLGEATGKEHKLPVALKDVRPAGDNDQILRGHLRIGKNVTASTVENSIILADGNVQVSILRNSIVIARGIAATSTIENSILIAGRYARASSDRISAGKSAGSVVLSRGFADVSFARGTTICAPLGIEVSLAQDATFINSKVLRAATQNNVKNIDGKPLPLGEPPASPLEKQLELIGYASAPQGALFRFAGRRLFAEKEQPIVDERGEPVKELAGWKLAHVDARMALFTSGEQEACVFKGR
jgi:hypothetical protein